MAGIVPNATSVRKTPRKQWTLHDGPRGTLRRLRSQLAEDGCPDSQFVLAKQLLEEQTTTEGEHEENVRTAIYWLVKASEQGNEEATQLLQEHYNDRKGITDQNLLDVKKCLNMSQDEKLARRAARELFISLSGGQDFVTTNQLESKLKKCTIHNCQLGSKHPNSEEEEMEIDKDLMAENVLHDGEKVTEDVLVSSASTYSTGELPDIHNKLHLHVDMDKHWETLSFVEKSVLHPVTTVQLYEKSVEFLSRRGSAFLLSLIPVSQLKTIALLVMYALLGPEQLLIIVPLLTYYASYATMVVLTFKLVHKKHEFGHFKLWSNLLGSYMTDLNKGNAEMKFWHRNMLLFVGFLLALLVHVSMQPHLNPAWVLNSEMTVLSFLLAFQAFFLMGEQVDSLVLLSIIIHAISRMPVEHYIAMFLPDYVEQLGLQQTLHVSNTIHINISCQMLATLFVPVVLVRMALKYGHGGIYQKMLPHLVGMTWFQLGAHSFPLCNSYGLARGVLLYGSVLLFLPVLGLLLLFLPIIAIGRYLLATGVLVQVTVTVGLLAVPLILIWWGRRSGIVMKKYITLFQVIFGFFAICSFVPSLQNVVLWDTEDTTFKQLKLHSLPWSQYQNNCHQTAWEEASVAHVQVACAHLTGTPIYWEGYVTAVNVRKMENSLKAVLDVLPSPLKKILMCVYGEKLPEKCEVTSMSELELHHCKLMKAMRQKCHVNSWNKYELEIGIQLKDGMWGRDAVVTLVADNAFSNFTLGLRTGDKIRFLGLLGKGVGGPRVEIDLMEVRCIACKKCSVVSYKKEYVFNIGNELLIGCKAVFNFFFHPVVQLK